MRRPIVVAAMVSVISLLSLASVPSLHAAPPRLGFHHAAADEASTGKMISFSVRNDSKSTLVVKAGEQQFTIEPGKTSTLKVAEGMELINVNGSDKQPAGSLLTKVSKQLKGNTLVVS